MKPETFDSKDSTPRRRTLYGASINELRAVVDRFGAPRHTATQLSQWLYRHHANSFEEMSNLKKSLRSRIGQEFTIEPSPPRRAVEDPDGTRKYLFETEGGYFIESAVIPAHERTTLCVSSQAGCARGCTFCATGAQGLQANLSVAGILNQYRALPERDEITNIVFMGMGEPLDNVGAVIAAIGVLTESWGYGMSARRITVSTSGGRLALARVLAETSVHIAVSVHTPFSEERLRLIPGERAFPLAETMDLLATTPRSPYRKVTLEYVVLPGRNDSADHARALAREARRLGAGINVIPYNPVLPPAEGLPAAAVQGSGEAEKAAHFRDLLMAQGAQVRLRRSRGRSINAACGMLSTLAYSGPTSTPGA
jgi:23S rRNA (adenine2503-C2)-methyltransferase